MRIRTARRVAAVLAAGFAGGIAACGDSTAPAVPVSNDPTYSISVSGDVHASVAGIPTALRLENAYKEFDQSGQAQSTAVVLVQLTPADTSQPRLSIGLMGPIQPGTFTVRVFGASPPGSRPELYASLMQKRSDGSRDYSASTGTVTLTSAGSTLHGRFQLHFGSVVIMPPGVTDGGPYPATPANLDATGTFIVPAPTAAHP